jgi:hypothetical protein
MSTTAGPSRTRAAEARHTEGWAGGWRRYDLVKEFIVALLVVSLLTVGLAVVFSSPDVQPVPIAGWAGPDHKGFLTAAVSELDGTSDIAGYGPPTPTPRAPRRRSGRSACHACQGSASRSTPPSSSSSARSASRRQLARHWRRRWPATSQHRRPSRAPGPTPTPKRWTRSASKTASRCLRLVTTAQSRPCCPTCSPRREAAASTARCSPQGSSTRPTTPSPSCSSRRAATSRTRRRPSICSVSSGA